MNNFNKDRLKRLEDSNEEKWKRLTELYAKLPPEAPSQKSLWQGKLETLKDKTGKADRLLQSYLSGIEIEDVEEFDRDIVRSYRELRETIDTLERVLAYKRRKIETIQEFVNQQKEINEGLQKMIQETKQGTQTQVQRLETDEQVKRDLAYVCQAIAKEHEISDLFLIETALNQLLERQEQNPDSPFINAGSIYEKVIDILDKCHMIEKADDGNLIRLIDYGD